MKVFHSKTVHHFFYFGGLFSCALCVMGIFFFKEEAIDGMMAISFWSCMANLILYFIFPVSKMVEEYLPSQRDLYNIGAKNIDRDKWKKEVIENEKERLLTPGFGFLAFLFVLGTNNSEVNDMFLNDMIFVKILFYLIAGASVYAILEILVGYPKPSEKIKIKVE